MQRLTFFFLSLVGGVPQELSEYRTRLIADVVTGQVDVREAAG